MKVKIIRHGERMDYSNPLYWAFHFGHYWYDSPLTTNGHNSARKKGVELKNNGFNPKYIITSPYLRTLETSSEINMSFNATIQIEPLLSEYQKNYIHRTSLYPNGIPTTFNGNPTTYKYPETYDVFKDRVIFIINSLLFNHDDDMIIVSHGELIKVYALYLLELYITEIFELPYIDYLTILSFDYEDGQIIKESINIQ